MSEKYYISSELFYEFKKKNFFREIDKDSFLKINKSNFKEEFRDYGWDELDFLWDLELGDNFMLLDCGAHGDCLFHCLAEALNLDNICKGDLSKLYDVQILREDAASQLNSENFDLILQNYKIEKEEGEFQGDWNPDEIETIIDFKKELCTPGNNFWGDHIILQLLSQTLKKNIIVLNGDEDFEKLSYNIIETPSSKGYIIIYFENNCHYKLVGKFNGKKIITIFNKIPEQLLNL
jgi:hypothetical protein